MPNVARALSGKFAQILVDDVGGTPAVLVTATKWTLNLGADIQTYNSIDSGGWTSTVAAAFSGDGNLEVTMSPDDMIGVKLASGGLYIVKLMIDSEAGAYFVQGDARIGKFQFNFDRAGAPQLVSIPFQTDGPWAGDEMVGDLTGGSGFTYS